MGMLDGDIAAIFGEAFGALYLDGSLHAGLTQPIYNNFGDIIGYTGAGDTPIKVQTDAATYSMRQADGFVDGDVALIVLANGIGKITTDYEVTDGFGNRYKVQSTALDAANSHYVCRGRAA